MCLTFSSQPFMASLLKFLKSTIKLIMIKNLTFFQKFSIFNLILLALVAGMEMSYHGCISGISNFIEATAPSFLDQPPYDNFTPGSRGVESFMGRIGLYYYLVFTAKSSSVPVGTLIVKGLGFGFFAWIPPATIGPLLLISVPMGSVVTSSPAVGEPVLVYPKITPEMYAEFQRHLEMLSFLDTVSTPFICFVVASLLLYATLVLYLYIYHKNVPQS